MPLLNSELPGIGSGTFFPGPGKWDVKFVKSVKRACGPFFDKLKENQPPRALDRFDKA